MANYPKPSMCDCEDTHVRECLFFDPFYDDPIVAKYAKEYNLSKEDLGFVFTEDDAYAELEDTDTSAVIEIEGTLFTTDGKGSLVSLASAQTWKNYAPCRHYLVPFQIPGTVRRMVYASSWSATPLHRHEDDIPDVGCYLDKCWMPTENFAYVVGWTDYGVPTIPDVDVIRTARFILDHAEDGEAVEVGCMGGHGRTGSFLAILALVANPRMPAKQAIDYVRDNYCYHAIETKKQEIYIRRISGILKRGEA